MRAIRTSIKNNKSLFLFISIIFWFGIVTGVLFYFKQDLSLRKEILVSLASLFQRNVFDLSNVFYHLFLFILLIAFLFCFIGLPLLVVFIFFEGVSIGFIIPIFVSLFKINAIGYFLAYFFFIKFIYLFLLFFLFVKFFHFIKTYLYCLKNEQYLFMTNLKYIIFLVLCILMNDFLVYFLSNRILIFLLG